MLLRAGMLGGVRFALAYEEGGFSMGLSPERVSVERFTERSTDLSSIPMVSRMNHEDLVSGGDMSNADRNGVESNGVRDVEQGCGEMGGAEQECDGQRDGELKPQHGQELKPQHGQELEPQHGQELEPQHGQELEPQHGQELELQHGQHTETPYSQHPSIEPHNPKPSQETLYNHINKDEQHGSPQSDDSTPKENATSYQSVDLFGVDTVHSPLSVTPMSPSDPQQSLITDLVSLSSH